MHSGYDFGNCRAGRRYVQPGTPAPATTTPGLPVNRARSSCSVFDACLIPGIDGRAQTPRITILLSIDAVTERVRSQRVPTFHGIPYRRVSLSEVNRVNTPAGSRQPYQLNCCQPLITAQPHTTMPPSTQSRSASGRSHQLQRATEWDRRDIRIGRRRRARWIPMVPPTFRSMQTRFWAGSDGRTCTSCSHPGRLTLPFHSGLFQFVHT